MKPARRINRRQFVRESALASLAGPFIFPGILSAKGSPSDRINLGFIGVGTMGGGHVRRFLNHNDVQIVAICDVVADRRTHYQKMVENHYARAREKKGSYAGCKIYNDFRELLARPDIDAVVIATPDHWHAIPCILAANARKDIYCEKPLTHTIAEGRKIVDAVKKNKIIFQTGSQQRSEFGGRFRHAVELILNGAIGKVKTVRIGVGGSPKLCDLPGQPIPQGTDWDLWLGPAQARAYNEVLCPRGIHKHFPAWRNYKEFGGGGLADMGAHHFDIAQWALGMDQSGPVKVEPPEGNATTGLKFTYANGVVMFHGGPTDCLFEGTEGSISVSREKISSTPKEIVKQSVDPKGKQIYPSHDHAKNWLDCIRDRKDPICTAETGQRSASICHLANIGYELRRPLRWNPEMEQFENDRETNMLLDKPRRKPWTL